MSIPAEDAPAQPITDRDTTIQPDDPAQAEWERTAALDAGADPDEVATATGGDPAEIPADDDQVPADDLPGFAEEPDTQGSSPVAAELGEDGQGDLGPEDL